MDCVRSGPTGEWFPGAWKGGSFCPIKVAVLFVVLSEFSGLSGSVAFSADGKTFASAEFDGSVRLLDSASHRLIASIKQHKGWVLGVAFSTDGKCLISSGEGGVRFWNLNGAQTTNTHSTTFFGADDYCIIDHTNNQFIEVVGEAERFARWFNLGPPAQWLATR